MQNYGEGHRTESFVPLKMQGTILLLHQGSMEVNVLLKEFSFF